MMANGNRFVFCTVTLVLMLSSSTVHPPAAANPLIMIHSHASLSVLWQPILIGVIVLAVVAAIWSRLVPGGAHCPCEWLQKSPPYPSWGSWLE